ncbi:MAG: hypothetical protein ACM3NQ_01335 [Bacteroidales bacterium]
MAAAQGVTWHAAVLQFTDGTTNGPKFYYGSGDPSGGNDGDTYLKTDGSVWSKVNGVWRPKANLTGGNAFTGLQTVSSGGLHVGSASDPGNANLIVDGTVSNTFASGWIGSGYQLDYGITYPSTSYLELDRLRVRGKMDVYELLVHQIRATNGSIFVANTGKAKAITNLGGGSYSIETETDHGFLANDLIRAQRFTGSGVYQSDMTVTGITDSTHFTATLRAGGYDAPAAGMEYVRLGNTSDTDRQGSIYLTADDTNAPYIDILTGVSAFTEWGSAAKTVGRIGNLNGWGGYSTNTYGLGFGVTGSTRLTIDPTNGIAIYDSNNVARFTVDNAGNALFTGTVTIGYARNMLTNSEFKQGLTEGYGSGATWIANGYSDHTGLSGAALIATTTNAPSQGGTMKWSGTGTVGGGVAGYAIQNIPGTLVTVEAGKRYEFSMYTAVSGAGYRSSTLVYWYDAGNTLLSVDTSTGAAGTPGATLANWGRDVQFYTAPTGAVYAMLATRCNMTVGQADPACYFTRLLWAEAVAGQTTASLWAPGGVTTITGDSIKTGTITAEKIATNTITADRMNVTSLDAISATLGSVTVGTNGYVRQGQTAYDTGTGWWIGDVSGTPKFSIGNSAGDRVTWNGTSLAVFGTINASAGYFGTDNTKVAIEGGGLVIGAAGAIRTNSVASYGADGNGCFIGYESGAYKFRCANVVGGAFQAGIMYDGAWVSLQSVILNPPTTGVNLDSLCIDTAGYFGTPGAAYKRTGDCDGSGAPLRADVDGLKAQMPRFNNLQVELQLVKQEVRELQAHVQALLAAQPPPPTRMTTGGTK